MPTVQIRNPENVALLSADLQLRYEPNFAWVNAVSAHLFQQQLRAFWPASSVDENGNLLDLSGQGRTLTNNNGVLFGTTGLAPIAAFGGANQHLSRATEAGLNCSTALTLGGWFNPDNLAVTRSFMAKWLTAGNQRSYWLNFSSVIGAYNFRVSTDGAAEVRVDSTYAEQTGAWQHIVGRFTASSELAIFVNGQKDTNVIGIPATLFVSTADFNIGAYENGTLSLFDGNANLFFVCAAALPDAVILQDYQQTRAIFGV